MKHLTAAAAVLIALTTAVLAKDIYPPVDVLFQAEASVIGEPLEYPKGKAQITSAIVTMQPGQVTGWHRHQVPLVAYILEGEITVDYGTAGVKTYSVGDSFVEAFQSRHNGSNSGAGIARILAVFAGAEGVANTVAEK